MKSLRAWLSTLWMSVLTGLAAGVVLVAISLPLHAQALLPGTPAVAANTAPSLAANVAAPANTAAVDGAGDLMAQATDLVLRNAQPAPGLRVSVEAGTLDPRLRLAPCQKVETYLPPGFAAWGKTRIGLRCLQGSTRWNVYLPITVKVYGRAWVAASALPAGAMLTMADLREAEVDLAADRSPAVLAPDEAIGRSLTRAVSPGDSLRQSDLRARQWFAAGDTVKVNAVGPGFSVQSEGQAMTHGLDGNTARVRIDNGRIVTGTAVGERLVEVRL